MTRKQKALSNVITNVLKQIVTIVCGLILPRYILITYGSNVNGLLSSITQFLSLISLMDLGVGAVVQSALYKPLASNDKDAISAIFKASSSFFKKVALIFLVYCLGLVFLFPLLSNSTFDWLYIASLLLIIAFGSFVQYYFGLTRQLLLTADQKNYIPSLLQIITIIINTILSVILMRMGFSIHFVKASTALIYLIRPIGQALYVNKHYQIYKNAKIDDSPLKQKWNGLIQHISAIVVSNTDIILLTIFSSFAVISVYSVYYSVVFAVSSLLLSVIYSLESYWGNLLSNKEYELISKRFDVFEYLLHAFVTIVFSSTGYLIVPFVLLYTNGVDDVNYSASIFSYLIVAAYGIQCLRTGYYGVIKAAGHFKQTQLSAIIQVVLNLSISLALIKPYGLIGVAIGTLVAMIYQELYFSFYLTKKILFRKKSIAFRHLIIDGIHVVLTFCLLNAIPVEIDSVSTWILIALIVLCTTFILRVILDFFFNRNQIINLVSSVKNLAR